MRHSSISRVLAAMLLVAIAGCTATSSRVPPRVDLTDASLHPRVGQRITVTGLWNPLGVQGPYVSRPEKTVDGMIYLKAAADSDCGTLTALTSRIKEGSTVEVTGVLRWYKSPPVPTGMNPEFYQRAPDHFYFDVADAQIKEVAR